MNANLCTLYIVRHGESQANVEKRIAGQYDSPLTEAGIRQAQTAAQRLQHIHFDFAFSSDLLRAKQTAEIIAAQHNLTVATNKLLRERAFGRFENKKYEEVEREYDQAFNQLVDLSLEKRFTHKLFPDVESDSEIATRFIHILREIAIGHPGKTGLIGSHGGIMRSFLIHLGWGTYDDLQPGSILNTASITLETDGLDFFIKDTYGVNKAPQK